MALIVDVLSFPLAVQDLVSADRFGMSVMKMMCENTVPITIDNCARLLELSDLLSAPRLREVRTRRVLNGVLSY